MTIGGGNEVGSEKNLCKSEVGSHTYTGQGSASPSFNKVWEVASSNKTNTATSLPSLEVTGLTQDSDTSISEGGSGQKTKGYEVALNNSDSPKGKGTSIYKDPLPKPKEEQKQGERSSAKEIPHEKDGDKPDAGPAIPAPREAAAREAAAAAPANNMPRLPQGGPRAPEVLPAGSKPFNKGAK